MPTKPFEMNIQSRGIAQEEPVFFDTTNQHETTEKDLCNQNEETGNTIPNEPPVITVSYYYASDLHKNTTIGNLARITEPSRLLTEQNSDPLFLNFKRELFRLRSDEQILKNDARYM